MFAAAPPVAFLATTSADAARRFYAGTLGLTLLNEDEFSLVFDLAGTPLRLQKVREFQPHPFTALGWQVDDAVARVTALRAAGVVFERYPFLPQDAYDLWTAPGGARIAWFRDPDGNLLSLTEPPAPSAQQPPARAIGDRCRPFLPSRNLEQSKQFYLALGFELLLDAEVVILRIGSGEFLLQARFVEAWAENAMMQLMVDDLEAWWARIQSLALAERFGVPAPRAPAMQPWGLRVAYLTDPAGVLWHVAQRRGGVVHD